MQVSNPLKCAIYRSWETCDKTTLVVVVTDDGVSLQHIDRRFMDCQSTTLQLNGDEAADVAARIQRVLRGEAPQNRLDDPGAKLVVTLTTDGDPYREGVSLALDTGDWERDFDFRMENGYARDLAKLMQVIPG